MARDGFVAPGSPQVRLKVFHLDGVPLPLCHVQALSVHLEKLRGLSGELHAQLSGGTCVSGGIVRRLSKLHAIGFTEGTKVTATLPFQVCFAVHGETVNQAQTAAVDVRKIVTQRQTIAAALMEQNRHVKRTVEGNDGHAVAGALCQSRQNFGNAFTGGHAHILHVFGAQTVYGGSGGGHLNAGVDNPSTTLHKGVGRAVVQQRRANDAVFLFLNAGGFSIEGYIAILKPSTCHF